MKKLKKMVLNDFQKMNKEELKTLKGGSGYPCWCGGPVQGWANDWLDCKHKCGWL